ncbi:hypothetical protein MLD52_15260 [Puniceicoccaceae bacterium K14]|nr:hypothetical protein [Puniceicoccaceae bacterium K14]
MMDKILILGLLTIAPSVIAALPPVVDIREIEEIKVTQSVYDANVVSIGGTDDVAIDDVDYIETEGALNVSPSIGADVDAVFEASTQVKLIDGFKALQVSGSNTRFEARVTGIDPVFYDAGFSDPSKRYDNLLTDGGQFGKMDAGLEIEYDEPGNALYRMKMGLTSYIDPDPVPQIFSAIRVEGNFEITTRLRSFYRNQSGSRVTLGRFLSAFAGIQIMDGSIDFDPALLVGINGSGELEFYDNRYSTSSFYGRVGVRLTWGGDANGGPILTPQAVGRSTSPQLSGYDSNHVDSAPSPVVVGTHFDSSTDIYLRLRRNLDFLNYSFSFDGVTYIDLAVKQQKTNGDVIVTDIEVVGLPDVLHVGLVLQNGHDNHLWQNVEAAFDNLEIRALP